MHTIVIMAVVYKPEIISTWLPNAEDFYMGLQYGLHIDRNVTPIWEQSEIAIWTDIRSARLY